MAEVEATHWWYRGLRDAIGRCLDHPAVALRARPRVLDAGCGTGETLRWLAARFSPSYLGGFDAAEVALAHARRKAPAAEVYRSDLRDPEIRVDRLDLILSLDVLGVSGLEASITGLQRLVERLDAGGLLVLNLPAYSWLHSEHDVAVANRERFGAGEVRALLEALDLTPVRLSYRLCALFPAVAISRLAGKLRLRRRGAEAARSDLHGVPGTTLDGLLFRVLAAENGLIARGVRLPWGSSLLAVGKR